MDKMNYVYTRSDACVGCNKCIFKCPTNANEAVLDNNQNKVLIKDGFCISCGECISICDHHARDYIDDLDTFFNDLKSGANISVIIAPAAKTNFQNLNNILGYLKSLGVNKIYDVSFGADICTWAHLKYIKETDPKSLISQPCPVIVSYVEKYHPELIPNLSPIQSPVICTTAYLKKHIKISDKIMLLSPCIGKKREISSEISNGMLDYNVTFSKFTNYIKENNINLNDYPTLSFDNIEGSIGFVFPRPGGLSQNIKYHLKEDIWIKSIEGIFNIEEYFKQYIEDLKNNNPVPNIIDALNCENGCNLGTGTDKDAKFNAIDSLTNTLLNDIQADNSQKLMQYFDENLNLDDYIRTYTDKSNHYIIEDNVDLEATYIELGKLTKEERNINCFSCGYGSCESFAKAMATGHNHKDNCKYYLLNKFRSLSYIDDLTGVKNRNSYSNTLAEIELHHPGFIGILFVDINGLKEANDMFGHSFGDILIKDCANILKTHFKQYVYRVGGDEFIILDTHSNEDTFSKNISNLKASIKNSDTLAVSIGHSVSLSIQDFNKCIEEADMLMYKDKSEYYKKVKRADRRLFNEL